MTAPLYQKWRPTCWPEVFGQPDAVKQLRLIEARTGFEGQVLWISGPSGSGKSTLAEIAARKVAYEDAVEELDATRLTVARLAEIERTSAFTALAPEGEPNGRAFVVNEAHGLKKEVVTKLLVTLEAPRLPKHVCWIFTTTDKGQALLFEDCLDADPLLSRCKPIKVKSMFGRPTAEYVRSIAIKEGLDGRPVEDYVALGNEKKWNVRAMLQAVESGLMLP